MTSWPLWGTLVNAAAVLLGALVGVLIAHIGSKAVAKKGTDVLPKTDPTSKNTRSDAILRALGLCVLLIGIMGAIKTENILVLIVSMAFGTLVGELLDLDGLVCRLGACVERRIKSKRGGISEGFVNATLLFCVGAMTVTGAIESGTGAGHGTYYAKSLIDMVSSVVFGSTLGIGVALSAVSVFITQGALTLIAVLAAGAIPAAAQSSSISPGTAAEKGTIPESLRIRGLSIFFESSSAIGKSSH